MKLPVVENRCSGQCCEFFSLSDDDHNYSYSEVQVASGIDPAVKDMIIPIIRTAQWWELPRFTCRHFDFFKRHCKIYDDRPPMCRRYGTEKVPCEHSGCTLKAQEEEAA